jgi:uncharacterized protein (TIGR02145 family)
MKNKRINTLIALAFAFSNNVFSQVGVGTTTPHASAELDVTSSDKGFLPPRMTQLERNAIASAAAGLIVWCTDCGSSGEVQVYNGVVWTNLIGGTAAPLFVCGTSTVTFTYNGASVTYGTVSRAYGGAVGTKCWFDRNLGATQVAASSTDANSYGHLFQWGRGADGHQITNSSQTVGSSSSSTPGSSFLTGSYSWYSGTNPDDLWQGVSGTNNPCQSGFRLPTEAEWEAERLSWGQAPISSTNTSFGAFTSPLKLPKPGARDRQDGSLINVGLVGDYWSSTVISTNSRSLSIANSYAGMYINYKAYGFSVRCIKD